MDSELKTDDRPRDEYGELLHCLGCGTTEGVFWHESVDRQYFVGDGKNFPRCPGCAEKADKRGQENLRRNGGSHGADY